MLTHRLDFQYWPQTRSSGGLSYAADLSVETHKLPTQPFDTAPRRDVGSQDALGKSNFMI
jgi:hypothetical protein